MALLDDNGQLLFFQALAREYAAIIAANAGKKDLAGALMRHAFVTFDANVAALAQKTDDIACRGGCAACCDLRVGATAPEILLIATKIARAGEVLPSFAAILRERLRDMAQTTEGLDATGRMAIAQACPFLIDAHCVIYDIRPLACRGHAAFDEAACRAALAGEADEVPLSEPHRLIRGLVQNALQSALRDAGLAWGLYEVTQALAAAADADLVWSDDADPFAAALIDDIGREEMAETFDQIKAVC